MSVTPADSIIEAVALAKPALQAMVDAHYEPGAVKEAITTMVSADPQPRELYFITGALFALIGDAAANALGVDDMMLVPIALRGPDGETVAVDDNLDLLTLEPGVRGAIMAARGITAGVTGNADYMSAIALGAVMAGPRDHAALTVQTFAILHEIDHKVREETGQPIRFVH